MKKIIQKIQAIQSKQQKKAPTIDFDIIKRHPLHWLTSGFGVGFLPAPGTFGTVLGVLLYLLLHQLSLGYYLAIIIVLNISGIFLCERMNRDLHTEDHPAAIWDEIVTFPIVMIGIPCNIYWILAGFLLFRFFDIVKPGPIGWLDRHVHGGIGVMIDDIAAAVVSLACLHVLALFT